MASTSLARLTLGYTVATGTLTNPSQLYFEVSVVGQPLRLDRLAPIR
jgi:hypothetical protein